MVFPLLCYLLFCELFMHATALDPIKTVKVELYLIETRNISMTRQDRTKEEFILYKPQLLHRKNYP